MSSINYQNPFGFAIKNHQEHPQLGKSYKGEIFFYIIKEMSEFCKSVKL